MVAPLFPLIGNLAPTDLPPVPIGGYRSSQYVSEWDLPRVRLALRSLDAGSFRLACDLRTMIRRDPRAAGAENQLTDTFLGFEIELEAGPSSHGNSAMEGMRRDGAGLYGRDGSAASTGTLRQIVEDLAGFAYCPCWLHFELSADGARWDPRLTPWPLEAVEVDNSDGRRYVAVTENGGRIPIEGEHWIEFRRVFARPHQRGAIRSIGDAFINRQFALGDWGIASAGNAPKRIGELPPDIDVNGLQGQQFARDLARLDQPYSGMIHANGGKVTTHKPGELSHKIHLDFGSEMASCFAIAYLGQDGTMSLGTSGTYGARAVLYGVAYDVIRGLATGVTDGLNEVERRRAVYNYGRSTYPRVRVEVPDLEAEQARSEALKRRAPMLLELEKLRTMGPLDPPLIRVVADRYGQPISEEEITAWSSTPSAPIAPSAVSA